MKVKDLIAQLEAFDPEHKVSLSVDVDRVTMGGSPRVDIDNVIGGIDWDDKVVFLHPPIGINLIQTTRDRFRELIEWKQLVSGLRGKGNIDEAKKNFIRREDLRDTLTKMIEKHFGKWYPSCEEGIFQCDTPLIESPSVVCEIMKEFDLFKNNKEEETE